MQSMVDWGQGLRFEDQTMGLEAVDWEALGLEEAQGMGPEKGPGSSTSWHCCSAVEISMHR